MRPIRAVATPLIGAAACFLLASAFAFGDVDPLLAPAPGPGPQQLMSDLTSDLFAALDKEPAAKRHNPERILPLVDHLLSPHFDMEYAGRLVLGFHWRAATPEQRQEFAAALYQRLLRTYAGAVAEWTPDRFKQLPLHADPEALQVTVHTLITNSRHEIVPVDFRLHQTAGGWKFYDVTVDGVSYVRNYRDDTDAEVAQKGLAAAITRLQKSDLNAMDRH
jgi:phospholipid transport system substrate-binding protein